MPDMGLRQQTEPNLGRWLLLLHPPPSTARSCTHTHTHKRTMSQFKPRRSWYSEQGLKSG